MAYSSPFGTATPTTQTRPSGYRSPLRPSTTPQPTVVPYQAPQPAPNALRTIKSPIAQEAPGTPSRPSRGGLRSILDWVGNSVLKPMWEAVADGGIQSGVNNLMRSSGQGLEFRAGMYDSPFVQSVLSGGSYVPGVNGEEGSTIGGNPFIAPIMESILAPATRFGAQQIQEQARKRWKSTPSGHVLTILQMTLH